MKFKDSQPEAGRLVEIRLGDSSSYFYSVLMWVKGIPEWSGNGMPRPEQEWRYSEISEPVSPTAEAPTGIAFKESEGYLHGVDHDSGQNVYFPSRFVFDTLLKIATDRKNIQQAECNNQSDWKSWSQEIEERGHRIKYLEDMSKAQVERIKQLEDMLKKQENAHRAFLDVLGRMLRSIPCC